jgi:hypothetical protein
MKSGQFALICCILIVLLTSSVFAQEDETIFNLDYLTKIHISYVSTIDLSYYGERVYYLQIQREAANLKLNNSLGLKIPYTRYSSEEIDKLLGDVASCYTDYQTKQSMLPNEAYDTIIFDFPEELKKYPNITFYSEYDIPQETKIVQVFRNHFYLVDNRSGKISVILPENTKPWYYSINPSTLQEANNTLILKWNNLLQENLSVTYGSTAEYLFYENKKDSLLNNFMTLTILVFTCTLSFAIYFKQSNKYSKLIDSVFILYIIIFVILVFVFFFLAQIQSLIPPFDTQYQNELLISIFIMIIIPLVAYFLIKKPKLFQ